MAVMVASVGAPSRALRTARDESATRLNTIRLLAPRNVGGMMGAMFRRPAQVPSVPSLMRWTNPASTNPDQDALPHVAAPRIVSCVLVASCVF